MEKIPKNLNGFVMDTTLILSIINRLFFVNRILTNKHKTESTRGQPEDRKYSSLKPEHTLKISGRGALNVCKVNVPSVQSQGGNQCYS